LRSGGRQAEQTPQERPVQFEREDPMVEERPAREMLSGASEDLLSVL
jgi:hypothetical protein